MRIIFVVRKLAITPSYIPPFESTIKQRRVVRHTPRGYRLCVVDAPQDHNGTLYMSQHYSFFDTYADALSEVARQANAAAAELDARKLEAVGLMCNAHDAARRERDK